MNTLYEIDTEMWIQTILRIDSSRASSNMKVLALALPDLLEYAYEHEKDKDKGTFIDTESRVHLRMYIPGVHRATGLSRNTIGRTFKKFNNAGVISYRFFLENWNGQNYNLSYVHPLEKLWHGQIALPENERGLNRRNGQKDYIPRCIKCDGTYLQLTGGIEYKCRTCGNVHVYYPLKEGQE